MVDFVLLPALAASAIVLAAIFATRLRAAPPPRRARVRRELPRR